MRIEYRGDIIGIHQGARDWLWTVFDEEGDEVGAGRSPSKDDAQRDAQHCAASERRIVRLKLLASVMRQPRWQIAG
ncbi:hypothetical protein BH09PSE1_BH09PSE1_05190 [soil metagenome]